jgi:hypothetical protein
VVAGAAAILLTPAGGAVALLPTVAAALAVAAGMTAVLMGILMLDGRGSQPRLRTAMLVTAVISATALAIQVSSPPSVSMAAGPLAIAAIWAGGAAALLVAWHRGALSTTSEAAADAEPPTARRRLLPLVAVILINAVAAAVAVGPLAEAISRAGFGSGSALTVVMAAPGQGGPAWADADLAALRSAVAATLAGSCEVVGRDALAPAADGARAALRCRSDGIEVVYQLLPDAWSAHQALGRLAAGSAAAGSAGDSARDVSQGCWDGSSGQALHAQGLVACWSDGGEQIVAWTDDRIPAVGMAVGSAVPMVQVLDWWWTTGSLVPLAAATSPDPGADELLALVAPRLRSACVLAPANTPRAPGDPTGATSAIACTPKDALVTSAAWYRFPSTAALNAWLDRAAAATGISMDEPGCIGGAHGMATWQSGRVACGSRAADGLAVVLWSNERTLTFGTLVGRSASIGEAYGWWQGNGAP